MALHNYFHFLHMIKNIALNHFFTTYPFHLKTKDFKAFTPSNIERNYRTDLTFHLHFI